MQDHPYRTGLLILQPTTFCNLDCTYCYLPNRQKRSFMAPETAAAAVRNLRDSGLLGEKLSVVWHAGEPLVAPIEFYEEALPAVSGFASDALAVRQSVQTNGTLLTAAHCELFRAHGVTVGLSLDGPAFLHDAHRRTRSGRGTHAAVMNGLRLLREHEIGFNVIAVLTDESLDHPDELYEFYAGNGVRQVGFNIDEAEGINTTSSFARPGRVERYRKFMRRLFDLYRGDGRLKVREFEEFESLLRLGRGGIGVNTQSQPFAIVNVATDGAFGTFSPELLEFSDYRLGNVHAELIIDALRDLRARSLFSDVAEGVERCRQTCPYFAICGGGAPSNKLAENGTVRSTETIYCRYTIQTLADLLVDAYEELAPASLVGSPAGGA